MSRVTLGRLVMAAIYAARLIACSTAGGPSSAQSTSPADAQTPGATNLDGDGGLADATGLEDATLLIDGATNVAEDGGTGDAGPLTTPAGVPVPAGWVLKGIDIFGTGPGSNVTTLSQLHAKYFEAQYYNRDVNGLVTIPNTVINGEQETYVHFETAVAWSTDHLTIQARGQPDAAITSGEMVSIYTARSWCTEAKYQIPNQMGSWPAFWFYGSETGADQSELDVEQPITANQGVTAVSMYNHPLQSDVVITDPLFTTQWMTWTNPAFDGSAAPHTYTTCYDDSASLISRYIDGALIYTATFKWNASLGGTDAGPNATTIVNLAVGGSWPGNVADPSAFMADLDLYSIAYYGPP